MARKSHRSRAVRWVKVRTPGGEIRIHYVKRKLGVPRCALCKRPLQGFPELLPKEARRGHRPPTRVYGGYLCHRCLMKALRVSVREMVSGG